MPPTAISRLLKSWAMPPVSWPTASIRWARLSARLRLGALAALRGEFAGLLGEPTFQIALYARLKLGLGPALRLKRVEQASVAQDQDG